jgi:hypothetical protein
MKATKLDIVGTALMIEDKAYKLGLIPDGVRVVIPSGSKTYGNAYRLHFTGGEYGTGHANPLRLTGDAFLGWTKGDACAVMRAILDTLDSVYTLQATKP